jgi:2-dehydro-3-deoxyglucarate aldolase
MNNDIFPNKFKAALAAHQIQIGCWSALASPITTEVLGLAGFDWLVLDGEHAPNDISTFIPQLMALKGSVSAPVVRVPTNEPVIIKRLLDIGFYNFLIPFVESEEEARRRRRHALSARRNSRRFRVAPRQHVWHGAGLLRAVEPKHHHPGTN